MRFFILISSLLLFFCINDLKNIEFLKSENTAINTTQKANPQIISINGLNKGDRYFVDGPLWYDGTARLEELNSNEMRISISIAAPSVGLPYQLKNGKINVVIQLVKKSGYTLYLTDLNKGKSYFIPNVSLDIGKTEAGWFTSSKEYAKITATNQYYEFIINSPENIYISSNTMPGGLSLTKR